MKKNDFILIVCVALYSILFYNQAFGVNYLIFSVALIGALLVQDFRRIKDTAWYTVASGALVSGICVLLYGTTVSFVANIVSLTLLSAMSFSPRSSVLLAGIYGAYSYLTSVGFMIVDLIERKMPRNKALSGKFWIRLGIGFGILTIVLVFFFLYQNSNPLFKNLTEKINLDFISWKWVRFTLLGFILLYGFFYGRNFPALLKSDSGTPMNLDPVRAEERGNLLFGKKINPSTEYGSGVILLALLNILLLVVNTLDIVYLWITKQLPGGMTYAEYLHQGTGTLITAVILAIFIMLFYFRGYLNFTRGKRWLTILAYLWIIQNMIVLISTAYRNQLYIDDYSLTYKRIGVYIWLLLTFVGLITTIVKIAGKKHNWYLFRANGWAFYLVLLVFACFNWDVIITRFNLQHSKTPDKFYLAELSSPANLPDLLSLPANDRDFVTEDYYDELYENEIIRSDSYYDKYLYRGNFTEMLSSRLYDFLQNYQNRGWQSWNLAESRTAEQIDRLSAEGKITRLLLRGRMLTTLEPVKNINKVEYLDISSNTISSFGCLGGYTVLKYLDASGNGIYSLDSFPALLSLQTLRLSSNYLGNLKGIDRVKNLQELDISGNTGVIDLRPLKSLQGLRKLNISKNEVRNVQILDSLPLLESLDLSGLKTEIVRQVPVLERLTEVNLSELKLRESDMDLIMKFREFKGLKKVNLSGNNIKSLFILTSRGNVVWDMFFTWKNHEEVTPVFASMTDLNVSHNGISSLEPLAYYPGLVRLDLSYNSLSRTGELAGLTRLEYLDLSGTGMQSFEVLDELPVLKTLRIADNNLIDLSSVAALKRLTSLDLSNNNLTNIDKLKDMKQLRELNLSGNQVSRLDVLKQLPNLEVLDISGISYPDLGPVYDLKQLRELRVTDIRLEDYQRLRQALPNTVIKARYIRTRS